MSAKLPRGRLIQSTCIWQKYIRISVRNRREGNCQGRTQFRAHVRADLSFLRYFSMFVFLQNRVAEVSIV